MIFFNLNTLQSEAAGNVKKFIALLEHHALGRTIPGKRFTYQPSKKSLVGMSFLKNPLPLFKVRVDPVYIQQYVTLAAYRQYSDYTVYNQLDLPLAMVPDLDLTKVKHNPLLKISTTSIQFIFES